MVQCFTQAVRSQRYTRSKQPTKKMAEANESDRNTTAENLYCNNGEVWFAMSAPYRRELKAKSFLEGKHIECYVPMTKTVVTKRNGLKKSELVPAIHNLIFVHTSKERIKELKRGVDFLQYRTQPVNGKNTPIIVPDKQMEQFITITEAHKEHITYLTPDEIDLKAGTRVRIHGGSFDGIEGTFVKIKGKRNKVVVVSLEGVAAISLAEVSPDLIEPLV